MRLPPPITSRTNARVKILRQAFSGRTYAPGELTAIEGENLLREAAQTALQLQTLFVREGNETFLEASWSRLLRAKEHVVLSRNVFDSAVDTATPQGIAATLQIPETPRAQPNEPGPVLLLENVQDPGNVGTLIRSAAAFGAAEVLLIGDCPHAWSPKVLRSSAGAVFQVPALKMTLTEAVASVRSGRRIFAAVASHADAVPSMHADLQRPILMIGNEGRGLSAEALALADERVTIPCRMESFNAAVAGSLLLYEAFRQVTEVAQKPRENHRQDRLLPVTS